MLMRVVLLIACLSAFAAPALAQKRVALVIGNAAYKETPALTNPRNDAADMTAALKRLGFDVLDGLDLDKRAMERMIRQFEQKLASADVGLFFYAGHGIQISGQNHLVPTDARLAAEGDVDFESLPLALVLSRMERTVKTSLVLLDACRDNPLARNLARTMGTRAANVGQGLAEVKTGIGTMISFSTQPGNVALDGAGRNSPYTAALLKEIETPGRDLLAMLAAVRGSVVQATGGKQVPWEHTSLLGPVMLKELLLVAAPPVAPTPAPAPPTVQSAAAEAWPTARDSNSVAALEAFIRRFGDTYYGDLAKTRLAELKTAEGQRLALLQQQKDEAARKTAEAEAARKRAEEEARRDPALAVKPGSGQSFRDCADVCPEMVVVPAGDFMMGSSDNEAERLADEGPRRKVICAKPFAVGKFEVTFAEWDACVAAGSCKLNPEPQWGRGRQPVINVSWDDATKEYLPWLSKKTGKTYRLLTEAEWEYAARAGTTTRYSFGNDFSKAQANNNNVKSVEVGQYPANPWGLHDMHGNVWEWVQDCYKDSYGGAPTDGSAVAMTSGCNPVVRGGSWYYGPTYLRAANRKSGPSDIRNNILGFRVGRTP